MNARCKTNPLPIDANMAYPFSAFLEATGLGKAALRAARRKGLPVRQVGTRRWILGRDWIEFLANQVPHQEK